MPLTPQGPPPAPRVALRIEHDVPCPDCGYNLRGLRLDGKCPECGRPTIDTFARPLRAATGVLAERMIRRAAAMLLILLAWWIASGLALAQLPAVIARPGYLAVSVLAGLWLSMGVVDGLRLFRRARSRQGGSSKPLQDVAGVWLFLLGLSAGAGIACMTLLGLDALPLLLRTLLVAGASFSAAAAYALAVRASATVLRRTAQDPPGSPILIAGVAQVVLIATCLAPAAGHPLVTVGRVIVGFAALVTWFLATNLIIGKLQEAQGSVVSLGRRSRRSR